MFVCALSARLVLVPLGLAMIKSIYVTAGYITMFIEKEVEEQVINYVGTNNYYGLQVVPVQQQNNGSDCRVFAAAFCHMSDLWDSTTNSTI